MIETVRRRLGVSKQLLKNRLRKNRGKRRYIHPKLGVEGFFKELKQRNLSYCVLRWFENLPSVEVGEDIDILVADEDIYDLEPLLTGTKSYGTPCDIYTVSGLPGTSYRGIAYFPAHLAREILNTSVLQDGLVRVPDPRRHLLSMAYHAVYHKGYESGVPSEIGQSVLIESVDHNYPEVLHECARKAGMKAPEMTLEGLDHYLHEHEWRPPGDALEKLSKRNQWINDYFFSNIPEKEAYWEGFSVFIVRESGLDYIDLVRSMLFDSGFQILFENRIEGQQQSTAAKNLRGGNWNRGPWPVSGGLPAYIFAVHDCFPISPNKELSEKHPGLKNSRLMDTKIRIRDAINRKKLRHQRCNILHSADNPHQAIEYFHTAVGNDRQLDKIETKLEEIHSLMSPRFSVIMELPGHCRRAKVELIRYKDGEAVVKTYRPERERFLQRELLARELGSELKEMSPILEYGENYLILPRYHDQMNRRKPLPLWILHRTREIILYFRGKGYELIDFKPKNILLDKTEGMKIIDFEFLQEGSKSEKGIKGNYCWYKPDENFGGDLPLGRVSRRTNYYLHWFSHTGVPLFFAVRKFPVFILYPVRLMGCLSLFLYHQIIKIKIFVRKLKSDIKRSIIRFLGRIIG